MARRVPRGTLGLALGLIALVFIAGSTYLTAVRGSETPGEAELGDDVVEVGDAVAPGGGFEGAWVIDTEAGELEDGSATFAGYRIQEELAGIGTATAVGRTRDVSGGATIVGTDIVGLEITVDMTTLRSDDSRRDDALRTRGLETDLFPTATFSLSQPIALGRVPVLDEELVVQGMGTLTVHGVAREVSVPVQARWNGTHIEVVVRFELVLADHGIEPPVGFSVLSVDDVGVVEAHLLLRKA